MVLKGDCEGLEWAFNLNGFCARSLALAEGKWPSLSSLDRRICSLFFYWSTWNVFLGAMLGGSAFSQLGIIVNNPSTIPKIIGTALPASSNFFINYVIIQVSLPLLHTLKTSFPHASSPTKS